jgi:predicted NAD/FAD-dependent oxidoreductase
MLMDAFFATTGVRRLEPVMVKAHRWRYALTEKPLGEPCLWDEGLQLAVCGDWCLGARVESAFLSGSAAAGRINALPGGPLEETDPPPKATSQLTLQLTR